MDRGVYKCRIYGRQYYWPDQRANRCTDDRVYRITYTVPGFNANIKDNDVQGERMRGREEEGGGERGGEEERV